MNQICIVIPSRVSENEYPTLKSLAKQTFLDFKVVISKDVDSKGAPWARNQGFKKCDTPFVLFSDNDLEWEPDALETLYQSLESHPECAYSYGHYTIENRVFSDVPFDPDRLRNMNYISSMSLVRTDFFPGWDENIKRLQDWDVWLTILERGKNGVYCGKKVFSTKIRQGITYGDNIDYNTASNIVKRKHGLL